MAFTLDLARASSPVLLHRSSRQPGYTSEVKTMFFPSSDHMAPPASVEMLVTAFGAPSTSPVAELKVATQTCWAPPRGLTKRNCLPSGDQRAPDATDGSEESGNASPPLLGTSKMRLVQLFSASFTTKAVNSTPLPSGEG